MPKREGSLVFLLHNLPPSIYPCRTCKGPAMFPTFCSSFCLTHIFSSHSRIDALYHHIDSSFYAQSIIYIWLDELLSHSHFSIAALSVVHLLGPSFSLSIISKWEISWYDISALQICRNYLNLCINYSCKCLWINNYADTPGKAFCTDGNKSFEELKDKPKDETLSRERPRKNFMILKTNFIYSTRFCLVILFRKEMALMCL